CDWSHVRLKGVGRMATRQTSCSCFLRTPMKAKILFALLLVAGAVSLFANDAQAGLFNRGGNGCCASSCCEPTCCEPTCCPARARPGGDPPFRPRPPRCGQRRRPVVLQPQACPQPPPPPQSLLPALLCSGLLRPGLWLRFLT